MLTKTDVHILVGLLVRTYEPAHVDVELGSMVDDELAEKARDVDVTVTARNDDGTRSAFAGTEVKDEGRPLDVTKVEQLCAKLLHMPALTRRAIVSGSGYTASAVLVAEKQGVELYELVPWDDDTQFDVTLAPDLLSERTLGFSPSLPPNITFDVPHLRTTKQDVLTGETKIFDLTGKRRQGLTLNDVGNQAARCLLEDRLKDPRVNEIADGVIFPVSAEVSFSDHPHVMVERKLYQVSAVHVLGLAHWTRRQMRSVLKVLKPYRGPATQGIAIGETSDQSLIGIVVTKSESRPSVIRIQLPDRLKEKIRRHLLHSLTRSPGSQ